MIFRYSSCMTAYPASEPPETDFGKDRPGPVDDRPRRSDFRAGGWEPRAKHLARVIQHWVPGERGASVPCQVDQTGG